MSVEWRYYTGFPEQVISNLKRSVTQLANYNSYIKVGITVDPDRRWSEHLRSDPSWNRMLVVYKTTSLRFVRQLEIDLIAHSIDRDESWNLIGGGGGPISRSGEHYIYILVQ